MYKAEQVEQAKWSVAFDQREGREGTTQLPHYSFQKSTEDMLVKHEISLHFCKKEAIKNVVKKVSIYVKDSESRGLTKEAAYYFIAKFFHIFFIIAEKMKFENKYNYLPQCQTLKRYHTELS
jgi:hypothetical protein